MSAVQSKLCKLALDNKWFIDFGCSETLDYQEMLKMSDWVHHLVSCCLAVITHTLCSCTSAVMAQHRTAVLILINFSHEWILLGYHTQNTCYTFLSQMPQRKQHYTQGLYSAYILLQDMFWSICLFSFTFWCCVVYTQQCFRHNNDKYTGWQKWGIQQ